MKIYFVLPLLLQKFIWIPTRFILVIFGRVEIRGLEHLKGLQKPVIFASNHSSEIDPFMVPACLPFWSRFSPLFYITREKSFYSTNGWRKHLFGGLFINAWGGYSAQVGLNDYSKSLAEHLQIIKDGGSFCIFPEGGITKDGKLQQGKGGTTYLSESANVPIIPVTVFGVYGMSVVDFFMRKRKITVTFGEKILPAQLQDYAVANVTEEVGPYRTMAELVMNKIGENYLG